MGCSWVYGILSVIVDRWCIEKKRKKKANFTYQTPFLIDSKNCISFAINNLYITLCVSDFHCYFVNFIVFPYNEYHFLLFSLKFSSTYHYGGNFLSYYKTRFFQWSTHTQSAIRNWKTILHNTQTHTSPADRRRQQSTHRALRRRRRALLLAIFYLLWRGKFLSGETQTAPRTKHNYQLHHTAAANSHKIQYFERSKKKTFIKCTFTHTVYHRVVKKGSKEIFTRNI